MIGLQDTHSNFLNCLIGEKRCFFRLLLDFVYFITGLMFTIFFISLLDAFNFADTNTMQDVSRIIYETRTELVHSRESLSLSVGTRNPKVWDLIPRGKSKFSFSYACNEAQKRFYSFSLADTFFNILLNISSQLLENLCVMPTIRGTKIYTNNLPSLRNVAGNLNAYFKKCSLSKEKNLN